MNRKIVAFARFGLCVLAAAMSVSHIGENNSAVFGVVLASVFALAFGANLVLAAIFVPPFKLWKRFMPSVCCFTPMFFGWFPLSDWLFKLGFTAG